MTGNSLIFAKDKFLIDKKWWTEEDQNDTTLFVEYKGIVFKEKMSKRFLSFVRNRKQDERTSGIQEAVLKILLTGIKQQITNCWIEILESRLEEGKE